MPTLLLAGGLCHEREVSLEVMRQPRLSVEGEKGEMKCQLCSREAITDLCRYHQEAKAHVESTYRLWVRAYGSMEWKTYLNRVITNGQTGQWAKEVAELLEGRLIDKKNP